MKTRQSGMPSEEMWQGFFDPTTTLRKLGLTEDCECVVDFGCGYGTFSLPAATIVRGTVHAIDIDPNMVAAMQWKSQGFPNIHVTLRDFVESGCGLKDASADYVMLFNILHAEESAALLNEAMRVLKDGGRLAVMHWNYDAATPRGPSMDIRLRPESCLELVANAGFMVGPLIDLPPYHYGFISRRRSFFH